MLRKMMLAGLMTATVLGGIAPAYAQQGDNGWRGRGGGERSARPDGGGDARGQRRGGEMRQQQAPRREQRPQAAPQTAPQRPQAQARPDRQWRGNDARPAQRGPSTVTRWNRDQQRWDVTTRADDRRDDRRDWRDTRRDDRRDDRVRNDGRRWNGGNWNDGRRFDSRTRWEGQRRWDNGWRNDRRYDWSSYRSRYGDRYRLGRYYAPRGWNYGYSRYSIGIFLNSLLYSNSYWIDDPYYYRLPPAYGTLRWIRYYDDVLLVDIRDGYVVDVIHNFFW